MNEEKKSYTQLFHERARRMEEALEKIVAWQKDHQHIPIPDVIYIAKEALGHYDEKPTNTTCSHEGVPCRHCGSET
jgi:hypothetical protein